MIKVGRLTIKNGKKIYPKADGYSSAVVMTKKDSPWWPLSPYYLTTEEGHIMENVWQFSKVYEEVPYSKQRQHAKSAVITWEWDEEIHVDEDGSLNEKYWVWRNNGFNAKYAVRYPVGYHHRHKCVYAVKSKDDLTKLNIPNARRSIYYELYARLAKQQELFGVLKHRLRDGVNIIIIEIDGPHQESLQYYIDKYGVDESFIVNDAMDVTRENINIMMNDTKHSFGHGYCLAAALLDYEL